MHLPAATMSTHVMLPLRFADGFGATARVYTFEGARRPSAAVSADPEVAPLVLDAEA